MGRAKDNITDKSGKKTHPLALHPSSFLYFPLSCFGHLVPLLASLFFFFFADCLFLSHLRIARDCSYYKTLPSLSSMLEWELLLISAATSQRVTQHPEMTHRMFTKVICAAGERGVGNFMEMEKRNVMHTCLKRLLPALPSHIKNLPCVLLCLWDSWWLWAGTGGGYITQLCLYFAERLFTFHVGLFYI